MTAHTDLPIPVRAALDRVPHRVGAPTVEPVAGGGLHVVVPVERLDPRTLDQGWALVRDAVPQFRAEASEHIDTENAVLVERTFTPAELRR